MFKGVNVCVYVGEGLRRSLATPDPFVLTNKICLNQQIILTTKNFHLLVFRKLACFSVNGVYKNVLCAHVISQD